MTDAACSSCGATDGTVRVRPWHDLDVALCAWCHGSLTGDRIDPRGGFTVAWLVLVAGLLLSAAGAAAYILTR